MALVEARPEAGRSTIQSYSRSSFTIGGVTYSTPVLVLPDRVLPLPAAPAEVLLTSGEWEALYRASGMKILIVGAGFGRTSIAPLLAILRNRRIKGDVMETAAACRTYTILLSEEREAAALLIP